MFPTHRTDLLRSAILGFLLLPALSARADTVILTSGKILEDVQTEEDGDKVRIKRADGASMSYPKSMVRSIEKKLTDRQELDARSRRLPAGDAAARVALAAWCEQKHFAAESRRLYEDALALDANCGDAHRGLGHIQIGDAWVADPDQALAELEKRGAVGPDDLVALWKLCRTSERKSDAWRFLHQALQTDPEHEGARDAMAWERNEGVWVVDSTFVRQDEWKNSKPKNDSDELIVVGFPLVAPRYGETLRTLIVAVGGAGDPDASDFELEGAEKTLGRASMVSAERKFGPKGALAEGTLSLVFAVERGAKGPFVVKYGAAGKAKAILPLP